MRRQLNAFAQEWVPGGLAIPTAAPRAFAGAAAPPEPCAALPLPGLKVAAVPKVPGAEGDGAPGGGARHADAAGGELDFEDVFSPGGGATPRTAAVRIGALLLDHCDARKASPLFCRQSWHCSSLSRPCVRR